LSGLNLGCVCGLGVVLGCVEGFVSVRCLWLLMLFCVICTCSMSVRGVFVVWFCGFCHSCGWFSFSVLSTLQGSFGSLALNIKACQTFQFVNSVMTILTWSDYL
jgi:hypothetical protein